MRRTNQVETLVNILGSSEKNVVNDEWVLSDEDIKRELEQRTLLDETIMAERQKKLDEWFPDRANGACYIQRDTTNNTFDF